METSGISFQQNSVKFMNEWFGRSSKLAKSVKSAVSCSQCLFHTVTRTLSTLIAWQHTEILQVQATFCTYVMQLPPTFISFRGDPWSGLHFWNRSVANNSQQQGANYHPHSTVHTASNFRDRRCTERQSGTQNDTMSRLKRLKFRAVANSTAMWMPVTPLHFHFYFNL